MAGPPRMCPWVNYPTHRRNRELQVNGDRPLVYGYCAQDVNCASCAGTLMKPNVQLVQGRPFTFVACPFCTPEAYRKSVQKLKAKAPMGSGPESTPLDGLEPEERVPRRRR